MSEHAHPDQHQGPGLEQLHGLLLELFEIEDRRDTPAELRDLHFNGAQNEFEVMDDVGEAGLSFGILNPVAAHAYVNFSGGPARNGTAIPVPAESALILPIAVSGHIKVGIDATELGANQATLYRLRFHAVQPFFLGKI